MKKLSKSQRILIVITIIYVLVFLYIINKQILPSQDISAVLFTVTGGIIVWLITHNWAKWIDGKTTITVDDFNPHRDTTDKILNYVKEDKNLILIEKKRITLTEEFYDNLYKDVRMAKISGIAITKLIRSITQRKEDQIVQSLKNNNGVEIKILISHPDSEFVDQRNKIESRNRGASDPCKRNIIKGIKLLIEFANKHKDVILKDKNQLSVHLSKIALPQAITYVESVSSDNSKSETLLMGFILYHDFGNNLPIYEIPIDKNSGESLFNNSIKCFEKIFDDSDEYLLFTWNEYGAKIDPLGHLKKASFFKDHSLEKLINS